MIDTAKEETMPRSYEQNPSVNGWGIDRRVSITNLAQLMALIIFGVSFYNQVNNSQQKNEERFITFAEERKTQSSQMLDMQKVQNEMLIKLTTINERQNYLTDSVKDLNLTIKSGNNKSH